MRLDLTDEGTLALLKRSLGFGRAADPLKSGQASRPG
jgi:hypothetical protein